MGAESTIETSCTKLRISNLATFDSFRHTLPTIPAKALDQEETREEPKQSAALVAGISALILRANVQYLSSTLCLAPPAIGGSTLRRAICTQTSNSLSCTPSRPSHRSNPPKRYQAEFLKKSFEHGGAPHTGPISLKTITVSSARRNARHQACPPDSTWKSAIKPLQCEPSERELLDQFVEIIEKKCDKYSLDSNSLSTKLSGTRLLRIEDLREIQNVLTMLIKCGAIKRIRSQRVVKLLAVLSEQMKFAEDMKIQQNEDTGSARFQYIMRALIALSMSLQIMAAGFTGAEIYREELLDRLVDTFKFHLTQNVFAWFDSTRFQIYKASKNAVDSSDQEGTAVVAQVRICEGTSRTLKRREVVSDLQARRAIPSASLMLSDILSATLVELSKVLRCIRLSDAIILQIIDLCIASLTVDGISLIQSNAVEVVGAAFECYPKHRGCILDRILLTLLKLPPKDRQVRRFMLPHDENRSIQGISAMLMKCIQCSVPSTPYEIARNAESSYAAAFQWSNYFWKQLLDGWHSARAQEIDIKALLQNAVLDILTALDMPEWPVSSVILQSLCAQLLSSLGMNSSETKLRELALEILGQITAKLTEDAVACDNDDLLRTFTKDEIDMEKAEAQSSFMAFGLANKDIAKVRTDGTFGSDARIESTRDLDTLVLESMLLWYNYQIADQSSTSRSIPPQPVMFYLAQWSREWEKQGTSFRLGSNIPGGSHAVYEKLLMIFNERSTECLSQRHGGSSILSRADSIRVCRFLRQNQPLTQQIDVLMRRLVGALEDNAIMVRAAAVRAVAVVISANPRLLHLNRIHAAIERRLSDSGTMVRSAIVELLGKHIIDDEEVADKYFPAIFERISDVGVSVRKRVINVLHKYLSLTSDSKYERRILRCLAFRILDDDVAIQDLVVRIFRSIWLSDEHSTDILKLPSAGTLEKCVDDRAKQLVEVLWDVYCRVSRKGLAKLPLLQTFPIVIILRKAIFPPNEAIKSGTSRTSTISQENMDNFFRTARRLCQAILNGFLSHEERLDNTAIATGKITHKDIDGTDRVIAKDRLFSFPPSVRYALALHVLCVTDKRLCIPPADPMEFATTLHPYIKRSENDPYNSMQLQCCISVLDAVIRESRSLTSDFANEIEKDLRVILLRNAYHGVLHQAAHCICTIADMQPSAHIPSGALQITRRFVGLLHHVHDQQSMSPEEHAHILRAIFVLGQMSRFGADALEASGEDSISPASLLRMFHHFLCRPGSSDFNIKRSALQACGYTFVSRPRLMLSPDGDFGKASMDRIMRAALSRSAESGIKEQMLQNLDDFFREEEINILVPMTDKVVYDIQSENAGTQFLSKFNNPWTALRGSRQLCPADDSIKPQDRNRITLEGEFQVVNGEHESHLANGVAQRYWPDILQLCVDSVASVRLQALHLVEVVLRQGLVHPMSCFPHLIALQADPTNNIRKLALRMLRYQQGRYPDFFDNQFSAGMHLMFEFCRRLLQLLRQANDDQTPSNHEAVKVASADDISRGCANIYKMINQSRHARLRTIRAMLRQFEGDASRSEIPYLCFLANVISMLPYTTNDEVLFVVFHLNRIVSLRAATVHDALRGHLEKAGRLAAGKISERRVDCTTRRDIELSTILSLILALKQHFVRNFELTASRIHAYTPSESLKTNELLRFKREGGNLDVSWVDPMAGNSVDGSVRQANIFFALLHENADQQHIPQFVDGSEQVLRRKSSDLAGRRTNTRMPKARKRDQLCPAQEDCANTVRLIQRQTRFELHKRECLACSVRAINSTCFSNLDTCIVNKLQLTRC